ncbi:MAG: radical SAM protein [Coriobacteriia bacterium]|nr:radical SAM protein [Coriobacteriia bacterium]
MLRFANIVLGESGAPRCVRCHRAEAETLRDASSILLAIGEAASTWPGGPGPNLSLTGAEPFHHPALFELLDASVTAGASRIRLESDAHALATAETVERTLGSGVRHLTIPLLGSTAELHDSLTGRRGSFERTVAGVKDFLEAALKNTMRVHVTVRVPVCRHNLHDTPEIVTLAAKTGANAVLLSIDDADLDPRQAAPWLGAACDSGIVYATWVAVEGIPYGCANGWELHLASMYHEVEGTKSEACRTCPLTDVCGGAMPGASERTLAALAAPPDAAQVAQRISHGFKPPNVG